MRQRRHRAVFDPSPAAQSAARRAGKTARGGDAPLIQGTSPSIFLHNLLALAFATMTAKGRAMFGANSLTVPCDEATFLGMFGAAVRVTGRKLQARRCFPSS